MLRLKTLGSIDLRGDAGAPLDEVLAQPKRIALLVYLAAAAGSFVRRDTLLALFWPELDTERARHSLRQALYQLRRSLGGETILNRGEEELAIDPARLWCDGVAIRALLKEGQPEEALGLYGGDFLAGFHPPDASEEFEDWIAATRQELKSGAVRAARRLAEDAVAAEDLDRALEFARWAAATDPLNEENQIELIKVLSRKGDKAGAERAFKAYADRLHRDLNASPSPRIRQALTETEPVRPPTPRQTPEPHPAPPVSATAPAKKRIALGVATAIVALALLGGATVVLTRRPSGDARPTVLAVTAIHSVQGDGDSTSMLPIADLLATSLARLPSMQVLSNARLIEIEQALKSRGQTPAPAEIARHAQATELLEGSVIRVGVDSLVLELRQVDLATGRVRHGYRVGARDVFTLVDRATAEIAREADVDRPARGMADVTTGSLVAYRLYEEGLRSYYGGDLTAAKRFFEAATTEDSTFAMAMWYLARTEQSLDGPEVRPHFLAALRLAGNVSDRERLLITSDVMRIDTRSTALAVAETLAARYPSDPEATLSLALAEGTSAKYAEAAIMYRRTIALDSGVPAVPGRACRICQSYQALINNYVFADSLAAAWAIAHQFVRALPQEATAWSSLSAMANMVGDTASEDTAQAVSDRLAGRARGIGIDMRLIGEILRGNYPGFDSTLMSMGHLSASLRSDLRWYLSISLRNQGRLREAIALARDGSLPGESPGTGWRLATDSLLLAIVRFEAGDPDFCRTWYRSLARQPFTDLEGWPGSIARERTWALTRLAMCRAAAGDTASFERLADSLRAIGANSLYGRDQRLHHYVRGMLWQLRRDPNRAAAEFSAAISSPNLGFTRINYELAASLLALHRPAEAVSILQSALRGAVDASNLYLTRTEIHERLAQAWESAGNADSARVHWGAVEQAWRRADPQFRNRYETALERLAKPGL